MKLAYSPSTQYPTIKTFTKDDGSTSVLTGTTALYRIHDYVTAHELEEPRRTREASEVQLLSDMAQLVEQTMAALNALETIAELDGTGDPEFVAQDALMELDDLEETLKS